MLLKITLNASPWQYSGSTQAEPELRIARFIYCANIKAGPSPRDQLVSRPLGRFSFRIGRENLWCCHAQVLSVCLSVCLFVCLSGWKRDLVCQKCASMQTSKFFGIKITFWDCSFSFTFNLQHQDSSMSYFSKIALTVTKKRQNRAPENYLEC